MGITFGKRKLKIKIMGEQETANEELDQPHNEQFYTVPKNPQTSDEKEPFGFYRVQILL